MQTRTLLTILMILATGILRAQAPILSWQKCFGGPSEDYGESITPTSDGGYIMVGQTLGPGGEVSGFYGSTGNGWVVKMDNTGAIQWQECLGGTGTDYAIVVLSTSDGGYLVGGQTSSPAGTGNVTSINHGGFDFWVVKLSPAGAIQWQNSYGGSQDEMLYAMAQTNDGGYILAGSTESDDGEVSGNHGADDYWVVKITGTGVIQWQKCLGGSAYDDAYGVAQSLDGGYFITGTTSSSDGEVTGNHAGSEDMWVVKLDVNGNLLWQNCLGGSLSDWGNAVIATSDGGCISVGYTYSNDGNVTGNHGRMDIWVVRLNSTGTILWESCYGGSGYEDAASIAGTADGGYLLAGGTSSTDGQITCYNPASGGMGWVIKIDATGTLLWEETLGGNFADAEHSIEPTADGGAVVGGFTESADLPDYEGGGDFYVAKLVPPPSVSINTPTGAVCAGSSFTFAATVTGTLPAGSNYSWNDNGSAAGSGTGYTITNPANGEQVYCQLLLSTPAGCPDNVNSNVVTIPVQPVPVIVISGSTGPFCQGSAEIFTATVTSGGGDPQYQWEVNGSGAGSSSNTFTINTLNNGDVISCAYSDNTGCAVAPSNTITAQVEPTAASSIVINASPLAVCQGASMSFTATATNAGSAPAYQWQLNGAAAGGNTVVFSPQALVNGDVISCTVTDSTACVMPSTAQVTPVINPIPIVSTAPPIILSGGQSAKLDLPVTGDVASYVWTPATGLSDPDMAEPIAMPITTTTYTLTVTSPAGCTDSGQVVVKVNSKLGIPSAFSPNGDGHNDIFYVIGGPAGSVVKEFAIFDRWGQRIFQAHDTAPDDPAYGWNGTIGGQPAAPGAYVYVILIGFADGTQQVYKGTVMLVR